MERFLILTLTVLSISGCNVNHSSNNLVQSNTQYPATWFAQIDDPKKPDWEILPQEAKAGEVILLKRNKPGILSNFAATLFEFYDNRYASVKGFWQSER